MNSRNVRFQNSKLYLGLTQSEWFRFGLPIAAIALTIACFVPVDTTWLTIGLFFSFFVCVHLILTNSRYIVFPGFATFITCCQLIIAPCLSYYYPPVSKGLQFGTMAVDMNAYFSFATPATIALWLGLHLLISENTQHDAFTTSKNKPLARKERRFMDGLIAFGSLLSLVPIGLGFFTYVLAQLRFVGALSWMLTRTKGWEWRIGFVLLSLLLQVTSGGVFYELVLWGAFILITTAYIQKWEWKVVPLVLVMIMALVSLNSVKADFRSRIVQENLSPIEKLYMLGALISENRTSGFSNSSHSANNELGDKLVRYNQGWIVSRVIARVPDIQPYGYGETISAALNDAVLPRFLQSNNKGAYRNSIDQFRKYTGYQVKDVSVGLGVLGEAFANFGKQGGIAMMFLYGAFIGYIFSKLTNLAHSKNIIWLSWIPFVLLTTLQAEWGLTPILNSVSKSFYVAIILIFFIPFLNKRLLHSGSK